MASRIPLSQDAIVPDSRPSSPEPEVGDGEMDIDHSGDPLPPSPPLSDGADVNSSRPYDDELTEALSNSDVDMDDWESRLQQISGEVINPSIVRKAKRFAAAATNGRRDSIGHSSRSSAKPPSATYEKGKAKERDRRDSTVSSGKKRAGSILQSDRRTPDESGESSGVEVTSARSKPLRPRPRSRSASGTPLEDKGEGTSRLRPKPTANGRGKPPIRPARQTRSVTAEQFEESMPPPIAAVKVKEEPFVPLSTAANGLDADDIIAQMRARTMARLGEVGEPPPVEANPLENGMIADNDSDDDDLADPSLLLKAATVRPVRPVEAKPPPPVYPKVKLPTDRSKYSLASMAKARKAESSRGWNGVARAAEPGMEEAETSYADTTRDMEGDTTGMQRDTSTDSELPDISTASASASAGPSHKRTGSDGALKRVAGALGAQDNALKAVQAAKQDVKMLDAEQEAKERLENRRFWQSDFDMCIEPHKPDLSDRLTGLPKQLYDNIVDTLVNTTINPKMAMASFPADASGDLAVEDLARELYHLAINPSVDVQLGNRALRAFLSLVHSDHRFDNGKSELGLQSIACALYEMGAKKALVPTAPFNGMTTDLIREGDSTSRVPFTAAGRSAATRRLLKIVEAYAEKSCDLTDNGPYVFSMLLALSCDPDEVALVHEVQSTLRILTTALSKDQLYATRLLESLRDRPVSDQYYALSLQPFGTQSQRQTAQSVSFALLFQKDSGPTLPTLQSIFEQLADPPKNSNFYVSEDTPNDTDLYYSSLLLQILLADIVGYVRRHDAQAGSSDKSAAGLIKQIATAIANLDGKLRTDVRSGNIMRNKAKNTLTRLQHGLEYQAEASTARTGALAKAKLVKDPVTGLSTSQTKLGFFAKPKPSAKPMPSAAKA